MSPQGQMTSPRGIVGGMGMMQQGGMANQQANNMYQVTHNFFYWVLKVVIKVLLTEKKNNNPPFQINSTFNDYQLTSVDGLIEMNNQILINKIIPYVEI